MIDLAGIANMERVLEDDAALHAELWTIASLLEGLAIEGRTIEEVEIAELRERGLSSDAIEFVLTAEPEKIRSVIGRFQAFVVKFRGGPGPRAGGS